jgi:multidrug efflux pump subunit AcrA (membrane-fusion protein)
VRALLVGCCFLFVAACDQGGDQQVETLRVSEQPFVITMLAEGELQAVESTSITPPAGNRNPRTIAWLAPNYGAVKQGDLVARFDVSDAERGALESGIDLTKVDLQVLSKERELERLLAELGGEMDIIEIEKIMAQQFTVEDTLAYSRFEIIDATRDRELLDYRVDHLENKRETYSDRQNAEIDVLDAVRATHESENQQHQRLLDHSEVRAPHDGFIVYEKNWWGLQVDVGTTVFPGNKIASIPNLDKMEAVLKVQETEAVGLARGQQVDLVIDAYPDRPLTGSVTGISATAQPIEQDNPVKYFTVTVGLDQADPDWITPGAQVKAKIHISQINDAIAIPNQALFREQDQDWVLILNRNGFDRRKVTLGTRGANRSQITGGLKTGDEIALYLPEAVNP